MKKLVIILLLASPSQAALTKFWVSNGGWKVAQDDLPPSTTNYNWNHTTASTFGGNNETVSLVLFIGNDTASNVSEVSVTISSFTGTDPDGIVSVEVSSMNVWDMNNRPVTQYIARYLPIQGMSKLAYEEYYDQYHAPERLRRGCTPNGAGCSPNAGSYWSDRPDHDKYYPEILEPYENVKVSSFTVYASSSQAVWFDIYIDPTLQAGNYNATITVKEGVTVSTQIPVALHVYNYALPDTPTFPFMAVVGSADVYQRHYNERFPANEQNDPYYTTRKRYLQMLHAHSMVPIGGDRVSSDSPYPIDVARLNGSLYAATTGYYGRGQDTGDKVYSIGTYGAWHTPWGTDNATTFCGHVAAWQEYFRDNFPTVRSFVYLHDETLDSGNVEKWAQWMSTATACQTSGYKANSFLTYSWPSIQTNAPHVNMPATWTWQGASSATWEAAHTHFDQGLTPGTTTCWAYNGHRPESGSLATDDDGVAPMAIVWAAFRKGVRGWFEWETTYYYDFQSGRGQNDLWNNALTFGGYASDDQYLGRTGWNYTNGDGVLMYPGTDRINTASSRGVNAPYPSWRLKMIRRGVQDHDLLAMGSEVDSATVSSMADSMIPKALWEFQCDDLEDCTYFLGIQSWSNDPDVWEDARNDLALLLDGTGATGSSFKATGPILFQGGVTIR